MNIGTVQTPTLSTRDRWLQRWLELWGIRRDNNRGPSSITPENLFTSTSPVYSSLYLQPMVQTTKPKERANMANANDYLLDAFLLRIAARILSNMYSKPWPTRIGFCNTTKTKNLNLGSASPLTLKIHPGGRVILKKRRERGENGFSMTIWWTTACISQYHRGLGTVYSLSILLVPRISSATLSHSFMSLMKKGVSPSNQKSLCRTILRWIGQSDRQN